METQQRRLLLAFLLMAIVLAASQWWYSRLAPPPSETPADTTATRTPAPLARPDVLAPPTIPDTAAVTLPAESPPSPVGPPPAPVVVETPLYRVVVDPLGGAIRQASLLRYPSFTGSGPVTLVPDGERFLQRVVDLGDMRIAIEELPFVPSDTAIRLAEGDSARSLELRWEEGGRRVVQRYRFDPTLYVVDYGLELAPAADGVLRSRLGPRLASNEKNPREDYGAFRGVARIDGEIITHAAKDAARGEVAYGGNVDWAGLRNKYFLAIVFEEEGSPLTAVSFQGRAGDSLPALDLTVAAPVRGGVASYRVFLGPQEFRRLRALDHGLDEVNQYGWAWVRWMVTPFAKLIVVLMLWLHQWIPSYGWVLVVFAILVRVVMWPLTTKSFRSIQEMQKLQPEIQRLRETHKSDPQRMQQETMRLYRERKVNPLGGCLPNLIPLPILFALFFVFQSTIELRGQPFLWLPDLSQPDPIYVLPVLMGLTMLVSSKMTMTDPKMAAMTYVMPIVLTFVFLNLAAGLVLYYTVSNVLTFAQQWWLRRGAPLPGSTAGAEAT